MSRCRTSTGRLFHSRGPATAKLLSPSRVCYVRRTVSVRPSVCPSITLKYRSHIGWNSWKIISRLTFPLSANAHIRRQHIDYKLAILTYKIRSTSTPSYRSRRIITSRICSSPPFFHHTLPRSTSRPPERASLTALSDVLGPLSGTL